MTKMGAMLAGIVTVGLLTACGGAATTATPTQSPSDTSTSSPPEPSSETPEPEPTFAGTAKDFEIGLKILKKKCFGSAGCNVTYRIEPTYVGSAEIPTQGVVEVTYEVRGFEDGASINTFTIEGDTARYPSEEDGSTPSSKTKLTAVATDVSYDPRR